MKRFLPLLPLILLCVTASAAAKSPLLTRGGEVVHGGPLDPVKADRDTVLIMGPWSSGAAYNGQFEAAYGLPDWNGWTHQDLTCPEEPRWTVSTYQAFDLGATPATDNLAAWCGFPYEACPYDEEGGYGNYWHEVLEWRTTVTNPGMATLVEWDFYISWDTEMGYDFVRILYLTDAGVQELDALDRDGRNVHQVFSFSYLGGDYAGEFGDEIVLQLLFESDSYYSDEDCLFASIGACQVDDISVTLNGVPASFTDFEDDTLGDWAVGPAVGCVGDFAMLRKNLADLDPCRSNETYQVTFIDDGIVVPGTGGSICFNWCYGPNGWIVTPDGGLAGPEKGISNSITSPVILWPDGDYCGALFDFGVYRHEDMDVDTPFIFYDWAVRSTASANPADIETETFRNDNWVHYGPPEYVRHSFDVSDLLVTGCQYVQVRLRVFQQPVLWAGLDGYPAPYFDNVRLAAYSINGPTMASRPIDLAQDVFPAKGTVNEENLGDNSCRFDMAMNISPQNHDHNDPGDSIVVRIKAVRDGSMLYGDPQLVWQMRANTMFDPYRTSIYGTARQGVADGWSIGDDTFAFDLPDTGFLFPGDVLHYCLVAQDRVGGQNIGTSIMPADTTGFSSFENYQGYNRHFVVHCLPTMWEPVPGYYDRAGILFWNDQGGSFGRERWLSSLRQIFGPADGEQRVDVFETNAPSSGVGNGLGGRAGTVETIAGYSIILYGSGDESNFTLVGGDNPMDRSDDIGLLNNWLATGNRNFLLTGDNFVSDLIGSGAETYQFATDYLGLTYVGRDLRPLIQNQAVPLVEVVPGYPVFQILDNWLAYGDCFLRGGPDMATFDAVEASGIGLRLAEFTDPWGQTGIYSYSAATLAANPMGMGNDIITLPYDLQAVMDVRNEFAKVNAPIQARCFVLMDILYYFGVGGWFFESGTDLPAGGGPLAVHNQPNPFNPTTELMYNMPAKGRLTLKIFNVRGERVRTLVDGVRPAGPGKERWDGADDKGRTVAAGVYFCEARALGQVQVSKMVVVR